ncbi:MAG: TPM domain-containing protein [Vulcanimicrobiota bacterium]
MFPLPFRSAVRLLLAASLACQIALARPAPIPSIEGHLTAPGHQLSTEQKHELDLRLGKIQEQARFDMAIYVLPEKTSAALVNWGTDIFRTWGIGRDWANGGALLVVSFDGNECVLIQSEPKVIPDKLVSTIEKTVVRRHGEGRLYDGLVEATERCRRFAGGKSLPVLQEQLEPDTATARSYTIGCVVVLIAAFVSSRLGWAQ